MLVRGGRVVDPTQPLDALRDIRIDRGLIVEIGSDLSPHDDEEVIDATNAVVAPGFVDMHVHLRQPGFDEKETIATGTRAAVRGGFTSLACMPNTEPALDSPAHLALLDALVASDAMVRVYPIAAMTVARAGERICDFSELTRAGAVAFSDDGSTVMNARVLRDAAIAARDLPGPFISHAEDVDLKGDGVMTEGAASRALGVPGSPSVAEDIIVARDLALARDTQKAWHIAHLSTRGALDALQHARAHGARATAEVTPHHLVFSDASVAEMGARAKVNPPLRSDEDVRALRDAVRSGTIDALATDHAPHTPSEKSGDLRAAAVGFTGLEIAFGAYMYALSDLPLSNVIAMVSSNPARILGIAGGTLRVGAPADLTIVAQRAWRVDPDVFASKGRATPFAGMTLPWRVLATIVNGELLYEDERF